MKQPNIGDIMRKIEGWLQHKNIRSDGTTDSMRTESVPVKIVELCHHKHGLQYTATGYGKKIPSRYMVQWEGRWRRVYYTCYSNVASHWIETIGKKIFVTLH